MAAIRFFRRNTGFMMSSVHYAVLFSLILTLGTFASVSSADDAFATVRDEYLQAGGSTAPIEGFVNTRAGQMHYVEFGKGPTVLLYHGFPSFWYSWKSVIPQLAQNFRVIAVDGLGANLSAKPEGLADYRVEALSTQLAEILDELNGGNPAFLVGHDWGAALVWSFAQAYPERVRAFAAISAPPTNLFLHLLKTEPEQRLASAYVERLKSAVSADEFSTEAARSMTAVGYGGLLDSGLISEQDYQLFEEGLAQSGAMRATMSWYAANIPSPAEISDADYWPAKNAAAKVPGLLIWGEDDGVFVPRFLSLAPQYAHELQVEVLPGVNHWPMFEAADTTNSLLLQFFKTSTQ